MGKLVFARFRCEGADRKGDEQPSRLVQRRNARRAFLVTGSGFA